MEREPYIRSKAKPAPQVPERSGPVVLRKHSTVLPAGKSVARIPRIEPGRTLLIPQGHDRERDQVASAWEAAGGKVKRLQKYWTMEPGSEGSVCVYGNLIFCQVLASALNLELLGPADDALLTLSEEFLGRRILLRRLDQIAELSYPCFVKSLLPKLFTSGVVPSAERLNEITAGLEGTTALLVCDPVKFEAEARAFICDRKVLDCALYEGRCSLDGALLVAESIANLEGMPFGFVVDLGKLGERWVVVELNPAWGAGLNGCDANKAVQAIAAATRV